MDVKNIKKILVDYEIAARNYNDLVREVSELFETKEMIYYYNGRSIELHEDLVEFRESINNIKFKYSLFNIEKDSEIHYNNIKITDDLVVLITTFPYDNFISIKLYNNINKNDLYYKLLLEQNL